MTAYQSAKCRCQHCRNAYAIYRAQRRAKGLDHPRQPGPSPPMPKATSPAPGSAPTCGNRPGKSAGLGTGIRVNDPRHAHASWLLAGGADIETVKERLGHGSILTTQKYLHSLPEADDAAVDAFTRVRQRAAR